MPKKEELPRVDPDKASPSQLETRSMSVEKSERKASASRRGFLTKAATATTLSVTSLMGTAALLTNSDDAAANSTWAEWFQGNYRLMTEAEKQQARTRLEKRY